MATVELFTGMPQVELTGGAVLKLEAIDATTGAAVGGVVAKEMVIYGHDGDADTLVEEPTRTLYLSQSDGDLVRPNPIPGRGD